jgi:hypothetical protein
MPPKDDPEVLTLLHAIRDEQVRHSEKLDELSHRVTGGLDARNGLEFRTAQLESKEESRKFWMQAFGVTAIGSAFTAIGTLISHLIRGSSAHP